MKNKEIILESKIEQMRLENTEFKSLLNKVAEFQKATDQPVNNTPQILDYDYEKLRYKLMEEENQEYIEASIASDLVEVLDSLVDQFYILAGTINSHGLQNVFLEAFNRVHRNNLTKIINGKVLRSTSGKIIKPEGFKPVNLKDLIEL